MQLSTRGRCAVMALVDLAERQTIGCICGPICLAEIAARQKLSLAYLEQLFGKLRRAGLVGSARGPGGGYRLSRPSDQITVAEIVAAVDEPAKPECAAAASRGEAEPRCQTDDLWDELSRHIVFFLESISLADVVAGRVPGRAVRFSEPSVQRAAAE